MQLESPLCKLEQLYFSCTQAISNDLKKFWSDYEIPEKDLFLDPDTLQGLLIYIVSRTNYPQIWTEVHLIEEFLPQAVLMSNRAFYMIMVKASCEYLMKLKPESLQKKKLSFQDLSNQSLGAPDIEFEKES